MPDQEIGAIIVAAGLGSRLAGYTENSPKCLLDFAGKSLLNRQLEAYAKNGVTNISVVRGYLKEKFVDPGIRYFDNDDYRDNNILNSIFYAEDAIAGDVIIAYSDILFEPAVVRSAVNTEHDIAVIVDVDWQDYYVGRIDHPIEEAENVIFDQDNRVREIGKHLGDQNEIDGEFIGMLRLTPRGAEIFKQQFHRAKSLYWDKPFQRAEQFQKAYLTDLLQEMVDLGIPVHCELISKGWKEIDTVEDYEKAIAALE